MERQIGRQVSQTDEQTDRQAVIKVIRRTNRQRYKIQVNVF